MSTGKLTKLTIVGYKDPQFKSKVGSKDESTFTMQVNPEKYSFEFKSLGNKPQTMANNKQQDKSKIPDAKKLNLKFFLDSTGVIPGCTDVPATVAKFNKLCTEVNGSIHTTNYLKIYWGKGLAFPCKLTKVKIDYLMFSQNGIPVRAELDAHFEEFMDSATDAAKTNSNSPDMSHIKTIKAGDNLPALCYEIYGDSKYYLQIAEHNGIINFRQLTPGQKVHFPRLEK
ncbi:MAG: LysM peptidoglycan-binding domain-containing protein [bacterium]|nr:LysM peptidoglycan-binding domain-containing protein [bacterium]